MQSNNRVVCMNEKDAK